MIMMYFSPPKRCFQGSPLRLCTLRMTLVGRYFWTWPLKYITSTVQQCTEEKYPFELIADVLEVRVGHVGCEIRICICVKWSQAWTSLYVDSNALGSVGSVGYWKIALFKLNACTNSPSRIQNCKQVTVCPTLNLAGGAFFSPSPLAEWLLRDFMTGQECDFKSIMQVYVSITSVKACVLSIYIYIIHVRVWHIWRI